MPKIFKTSSLAGSQFGCPEQYICNPTLYNSYALFERQRAVRIKCGEVSRLPSVFEEDQGSFQGLFEPISCTTRVDWNKLLNIFGEVANNLCEEKIS